MLGRGDDEQGVPEAALRDGAGRTTRRLGHRGRVGVHADDERPRLAPRSLEDRPTVTGSEVDGDPVRSGEKVF
jgi:hypothetical protein